MGVCGQREKEVMRGTLNKDLENVRMPAHHHHPRGSGVRVALNGSLTERAQCRGTVTPPLWENLVNSVLEPSPTLASRWSPKSRSSTMQCTYLPGPFNPSAHLIPTTKPLTHAPLPGPACSVSGSVLYLPVCFSVSVAVSCPHLLSGGSFCLKHLSLPWFTFINSLYFLFFLMISLPNFHFKPAILKVLF